MYFYVFFDFFVCFVCAIRLFFGGFHRIRIVNLEFVNTKQVFSDFIAAMWYFDKMISGGLLQFVKAKKYYFDILKALIDFSLDPSNKPKFDPYIIDSFHSLRQHKRQMVFDLDELSHVDKNIRNLVLHSCEMRKPSNESKREGDDFTNLFREELLSIFPNVEQVIIRTTYKDHSYSLSMSNLLSIISSSSLNRVVVDSQHEFYDFEQQGPVWTNTLWRTEPEKLTQEFASNGFGIAFGQQKEAARDHFKFIIVRI